MGSSQMYIEKRNVPIDTDMSVGTVDITSI